MVVTMKRGRKPHLHTERQLTERWADRKGDRATPNHVLGRVSNPLGVWTEDQDEWLKVSCRTAMTYGQLTKAFAEAFPLDPKSRSSLIARASRKGYNNDKPDSPTPSKNPRRKRDPKVRLSKQALAPVTFKDPHGLRDDAEPLLRRSHPHGYRKTKEQIEEAKKGRLPCIVEENPLTSVPFLGADGCKWPTNNDIRCMEVCGAPTVIGAYCERHGRVAYVTLPTVKRNRIYHKDDTEYRATRKRISDGDAQWIADNVLDDVVETGDIELIPNFIGLLNE